MKKVIAICMALLLSLPVSSAFAADYDFRNGLLEDATIIKRSSLPNEWVDNDLQTGFTLIIGQEYVVEFNKPVSIDVVYTNFSTSALRSMIFKFENGELHQYSFRETGDYFKTLGLKNVVKVTMSTGGNGPRLNELEFFGDYEKPTVEHLPVSDITATKDYKSVSLKWKKPNTTYLKNTIVKQNGVQIATVDPALEEYTINGLKAETAYNYELIAQYTDGEYSEPVSIVITTDAEPKPIGEVIDLTGKAKHNRVDLSWQLPKTNELKHVIIYRDTLEKNFLDKLLGISTVSAAATPIFETNGTYFNDLTVEPETKYEYTVTTLSTDKVESDGVSVTVTTLKEPSPEIEGGGFEKDPETGDFTYTWTQPTSGEVKVMVGGKLYKTVPASNGEIVIPAADMKFTFLGKPDVSLIPVSPDGKEGKPVNPPASGGGSDGSGGGIGEIDMPFKVNDLVMTTFQLIGLLAGIILTALAIQLVPRLIEIIKSSIRKQREVRK